MKNRYALTPKKLVFILVCALFALYPVLTVSAQGIVVKAQASTSQPHVGQTLTVDITISNVQNLYGVDVTLDWNTSVLKVISATSLLGVESHPSGVLHETSSDPLYVEEDNASQDIGEYHLVATSVGSAPAFSGSGTIATVTFNVTNAGHTGLTLETELADHPAAGETSGFINHTDTAVSVDAVIPEFQSLTILVLFMVLAAATIAIGKKQIKKNKPNFS